MIYKIFNLIKYILKCILDLIYYKDDYCICGNYLLEGELLCNKCYGKIKFCDKKSSIIEEKCRIDCFSSTYYSGITKELVIRFKYKKDFNAGRILCRLMEETIVKESLEFNIITFVPMTKSDLKVRGYNQSEFLAKNISKDVYSDANIIKLLKKVKSSKDQIGLNEKERWNNIKDCFKFIGDRKSLKNKSVLLVDDVITTGATAFHCSKVLLDNGASKVIVLTAAKSSL